MIKTSLLVGIAVAALAARADAGGSPNTIGVGAEAELSGLGGASVNYDAGQFHLGGFLGYERVNVNPTGMGPSVTESIFEFGGRFFYHLHSTAMSDFSVGGAIDLASVPAGNNNRNTLVFLEPSFQIRLFIASNVALSFNGGIALGVVDADSVVVGGQIIGGNAIQAGGTTIGLVGGAGVHYYFF